MARDRYAAQVAALLAKHGLQIIAGDRKRVILAAKVMRDAHAQIHRNAAGNYRPDLQAERSRRRSASARP